jgi:hypothetical protein
MQHTIDSHWNKKSIRERMLRFASTSWGVHRAEAIDPVVLLFLESLAEEIYKITGEVENLETRLLDKLSSLLVPGMDTVAQPSRTLLHAMPVEGRLEITTKTEFRQGKYSFYPVCNTRIHNGSVRYFIHNGTLYSIDNQMRTRLTRQGRKNPHDENSFWIGLELNEAVENLSELSFYFDIQGITGKDKYLNLLSCCEWKIRDQALIVAKGLFSTEEEYENDILSFFSASDLSVQINKSVMNDYENHFLTVKNKFDINGKKEAFPEKLKACFPENIHSSITGRLLWIEAVCPPEFTPELMDSLHISINVFPVVNRRLVSGSMEVNGALPFIPLTSGVNESFISVLSLADSSGKRYYDVPVNRSDGSGNYSLRRGGCERYRRSDAQEYLSSFIELLNGEIAVFFKNKSDIKNDVKKIEEEAKELLRHLTQIVSEAKERVEVNNYIYIDTGANRANEVYFVEYWLTGGPEANHIPAGSVFSAVRIPVLPGSVISLSPSQGGKPSPLATDKNKLYRKSLSENRLLVTHEDIKDFCIEKFSNFFSGVQVRRGLKEDINPAIGFIRTTDVYLRVKEALKNCFGQDKKDFIEQALKENVPATFYIRVFIEN